MTTPIIVEKQYFSWFQVFKSHLLLRLSSMEVVFHLFMILKTTLNSAMLDLQMLQSKFSWFPSYSRLFRVGGRLEESKIRLAQPILAGNGADLGNTLSIIYWILNISVEFIYLKLKVKPSQISSAMLPLPRPTLLLLLS